MEWELTAAEWRDRHPHDELNFILEGELHVESEGTTVVAGVGDTVRVQAGRTDATGLPCTRGCWPSTAPTPTERSPTVSPGLDASSTTSMLDSCGLSALGWHDAAMDLTSFKALSFDCYGTLIDWESGIAAVLRPWADEVGRRRERRAVAAGVRGQRVRRPARAARRALSRGARDRVQADGRWHAPPGLGRMGGPAG